MNRNHELEVCLMNILMRKTPISMIVIKFMKSIGKLIKKMII